MHRIFLFLFVVLFLFSCSPYRTLVVKKDLQATYDMAVKDASEPLPNEISSDLRPLTAYNETLQLNSKGQILVVTWTDWNGYDQLVGEETTLSREVWITSAPQLKVFSERLNLDSTKMVLRLEQLMGLPPHTGKNRFIEMWVNPADLFRPCPDPEIIDGTCDLKFPESSYISIATEHKKWIDDLKAKSYGEKGYPWTQLGYTYDWGNPRNHIGLSEFVIKANSTVSIKNVSDLYEYCGAKR
jgi:hypothetical protein